jgi:hypothetical protein
VLQVVFAEYRQSLEEIQQRVIRFEREIETLAPTTTHGPTIAALQAMRGVNLITAATIVSELGDISRFQNPRQFNGVRPAWFRPNTAAAGTFVAGASPKPGTRICKGLSSRRLGTIRMLPA